MKENWWMIWWFRVIDENNIINISFYFIIFNLKNKIKNFNILKKIENIFFLLKSIFFLDGL